jgi:hypothetical protein
LLRRPSIQSSFQSPEQPPDRTLNQPCWTSLLLTRRLRTVTLLSTFGRHDGLVARAARLVWSDHSAVWEAILVRTDSEIQQAVLQELKWDSRIKETDVGVEVEWRWTKASSP